ncbi:MAG: fumarylacetoacetate hydrolase family protein [Verrucomicrobia bacterium]|nr:fumarylacetoacetate hydrolase family protein [Verrucomicrobiota bacterium]
MKIARILLSDGSIHYARPLDDQGNAMEVLSGDPFQGVHLTGEHITNFTLLTPMVPAAILCIGLNYRLHAEEMNAKIPKFPVLFLKNPSAILDPGAPIQIPRNLVSTQVDYEGELAIIIGKNCLNATRENALDHVLGYTVANDVSARDWQKEWGGSQWCRGKSFDTFAPMGPWIVTRDEIPDPNALRITTRVNNETLQDSNTSDMIFDVPALIEFLSGDTTLPVGTVILTGTPSGVGVGRTPQRWLKEGDSVEVEIEKIGILSNPVT